jgi:hypothetical protein
MKEMPFLISLYGVRAFDVSANDLDRCIYNRFRRSLLLDVAFDASDLCDDTRRSEGKKR